MGEIPTNEEFRVENRVFIGSDRQPQASSTTIFFDGVVYDYLEEPAEVTVFDQARGRFILLDLERRVRTEVSTEKIRDFTERLKERSLDQSDPYTRFLGKPEFEQLYNESADKWTFSSEWLNYELKVTDAGNESIARQYRDFSDWQSQLNVLLNPGSRPPFSRLVVNAALGDRKKVPRQVELTLWSRKRLMSKRFTARSEHVLVRQLVESDRKRIAQTDQFLAIYAPVAFDDYQRKINEP